MAAPERPPYILDVTRLFRGDRVVTLSTFSDISPELVLMERARLHVGALQSGTTYEDPPMSATWRKRLANVTE